MRVAAKVLLNRIFPLLWTVSGREQWTRDESDGVGLFYIHSRGHSLLMTTRYIGVQVYTVTVFSGP